MTTALERNDRATAGVGRGRCLMAGGVLSRRLHLRCVSPEATFLSSVS
jgi:hypothetical protein